MATKNNGMDFFAKNRVADPDLQEEGVWVTDAYNGQLDIKVRRTKSKHATLHDHTVEIGEVEPADA